MFSDYNNTVHQVESVINFNKKQANKTVKQKHNEVTLILQSHELLIALCN